jgi:DNA-binding response OmpR family regulator
VTASRRVLIVDDDLALVRVLALYFEGEGYEVQTAHTGGEALNKLAADPDVVVLDVMIPDVNGIEVCRRIRETPHRRAVPVLIMTADPRYRGPAMEAGADGFVSKPFGLRDLGAAVRDIVAGEQSPG